MSIALEPAPKGIEELQAIIHQQAAHIEQLEAKIHWFMEQYRLARERQYGKSSEKSESLQQLNLFNEAEFIADNESAPPVEKVTISYERTNKKPGRKEIPENLAIETVDYRLPEEEQICACCGGPLHEMSTEERHELEFVPAKARVIKHIRHIYGCRTCEREGIKVPIVRAPAPNPVIPKSLASPHALAYVMTMKYVDGLPLYRQEKHLERMGVKAGRSMLSTWMLRGAEWLDLLYGVMKQNLLARDVLAADETTVQVLQEPGRDAETKSYMWLYRTGGGADPPIVLFDYQKTRSSDHPKEFLQGFEGYLQVDGYVGYEHLPGVIPVGCWAHARRKFDEAIKALPPNLRKQPGKAREGLDMINELFKIEQRLKGCSSQERKEQRDLLSRSRVDDLKTWLDSLADAVLPRSALGTAISYCRNQWPKLIRFLEDGRLELDNNRSERSIKPFVMGRKAWLFANVPKGAHASAVIYSIVETAKENKVNPYEYLVHLFQQLPNVDVKNPDVLRKLLPWNVVLPEQSLTGTPPAQIGTCG
jgi:transposase